MQMPKCFLFSQSLSLLQNLLCINMKEYHSTICLVKLLNSGITESKGVFLQHKPTVNSLSKFFKVYILKQVDAKYTNKI